MAAERHDLGGGALRLLPVRRVADQAPLLIAGLAEEVLERWPGGHPLRTRVLGTASTARLFLGDAAAARRHAEAALALEEAGGPSALLARRTLAHLALCSSERRAALALTQETTARLRAAGQELLARECDGLTVQLLHATGEGDAAVALAAHMRGTADRSDAPFMACWAAT